MYSFRRVEGETLPYLRGADVLSSLFSRDSESRVTQVTTSPGHVAVVLHDTLVVVFDAVPQDRHLGEVAMRALWTVVRGGGKMEGFSPPPECLVSLHEQALSNVFFDEQDAPLRLFSVQRDGDTRIWQWSLDGYVWRQVAQLRLLSSLDSRVKAVRYARKDETVVWWEQYRRPDSVPSMTTGGVEEEDARTSTLVVGTRLCCRKLTFVEDEEELERHASDDSTTSTTTTAVRRLSSAGDRWVRKIVVGASRTVADLDAVRDLLLVDGGVFALTSRSLCFYAFASGSFHIVAVGEGETGGEGGNRSSGEAVGIHVRHLGEVASVAVHPITRQLLALESSGNVMLCLLGDGRADSPLLRIRLLCGLRSFTRQGLVRMVADRAALYLIYTSRVVVHDARSGTCLGVLGLPVSRHPQGIVDAGLGSVGVILWWEDGMWELMAPPASKVAATLMGDGASTTEASTKAALRLCQEYGPCLRRQEIKNALGAAKGAAAKPAGVAAARRMTQRLAALLNSPALPMTLFRSPRLQPQLGWEVKRFLGTREGRERELLEALDRLLAQDPLRLDESSREGGRRRGRVVPHLSWDEALSLWEISGPALASLVRREPARVFAELKPLICLPEEEEDGTPSSTVDPRFADSGKMVGEGGERDGGLPFEFACRLLDAHAPEFLLRFVEAVENVRKRRVDTGPVLVEEEGRVPRSMATRALLHLPPLTRHTTPPPSDTRVAARVALYRYADRHADALSFLASLGRWREALALGRECRWDGAPFVNPTEVFSILLARATIDRNADLFSAAFTHIPRGLSVFNFTSAIRTHLEVWAPGCEPEYWGEIPNTPAPPYEQGRVEAGVGDLRMEVLKEPLLSFARQIMRRGRGRAGTGLGE